MEIGTLDASVRPSNSSTASTVVDVTPDSNIPLYGLLDFFTQVSAMSMSTDLDKFLTPNT